MNARVISKSTRVRLLPALSGVVAAVALVLVLAPATAHAWGARGHRIAARVAEARLTPEARAGLRALLDEGDTLADIAAWADREGHQEFPSSAPWHYVNVPISEGRYDPRFCSDRGCVVSKIKQYRSVLNDRRASRRERRIALYFLVHLIEDVHQPLHVGDNRDRGGNQTQVQYRGRGTNLHRLWDSDIINAHGGERDWTGRVEALVTTDAVTDWSRGDVEDWATESLQAAKRAYQPREGARGPITSGSRIGEDYEDFARPIIERRLAQAGVRLANALNAAFR